MVVDMFSEQMDALIYIGRKSNIQYLNLVLKNANKKYNRKYQVAVHILAA
jgi:hypothetical protein